MSDHTDRRLELFSYFEECVKKHFNFLGDMSCIIDKNTMGWIVSYVSEKVILSIYYERVSFEIYLTLNLIKPDISIYNEEILEKSEKKKFLFATNEAMVENAVIELKTLITQYCRPFLNGEIEVFENVLKERAATIKDYDLRQIEKKAVKAWEDGNHDEVVLLYQSIKGSLTPIQDKRLSISLKKIKE